jgi:hypothetical protein
MTQNPIDLFQAIENAAQDGAFGNNPRAMPTEAMCQDGNYKVGKTTIYGLPVAIEQPRHSYRTGIDSKTGKRWSTRLAAHYGYFSGTRGADNDPVDVFIGPYPQSEYAYIINQHVNGAFDEHKVMLCMADEQSARRAYLDSYEKGWTGLHDMVPASITQLKWWLKNGNLTKPLKPEHLPFDGHENMNQRITWDSAANPHQMGVEMLLYKIRKADGDNPLLLDSVSMADILEGADSLLAFDALVTPYAALERKMNALMAVMKRAGGDIHPVAMQISDPFKQNGVAQVAALFELSDGQTVTIYFHNPDVTPAKIAPGDELISWAWRLNKKDITIIVAPEKGKDLNVREVATRIMKLAAKNSPAFQRANTKRAESMAAIESIKGEIVVLEKELADVQHELEVAKVEAEDRAAKKQSVDWSKARELGSDAEIKALGVANIDEIGSENVYVEKDGKPYYFKPGNTERWQVGSHDFSNEVVYGDGTAVDVDQGSTEGKNKSDLSGIKKTKFYPVDIESKLIYDAPEDKEKDVAWKWKERHVIGMKGSNLLEKSVYAREFSFVPDDYTQESQVNPNQEETIEPNEQENQQTEVTQETETAGAEIDPNQPHIDTLQAIVDGQHDGDDLTELLDNIDKAAQALIDAGLAEQYDELIGKAAEHWALLDQKANG